MRRQRRSGVDRAAAGTGKADGFENAVDDWCAAVRARAAQAGVTVTLPGEPEARARAERRRNGVPVPASIWNALCELRERLGAAAIEPTAAEAS